MNELQAKIYKLIDGWAEFATRLGPQVSPNFYYAWLLRAKLAPEDELKKALRQMLNDEILTATAHKVTPCKENLYDIEQGTTTAVILAITNKK